MIYKFNWNLLNLYISVAHGPISRGRPLTLLGKLQVNRCAGMELKQLVNNLQHSIWWFHRKQPGPEDYVDLHFHFIACCSLGSTWCFLCVGIYLSVFMCNISLVNSNVEVSNVLHWNTLIEVKTAVRGFYVSSSGFDLTSFRYFYWKTEKTIQIWGPITFFNIYDHQSVGLIYS